MAPNVFFNMKTLLQLLSAQKLISTKCVLFTNDSLPSDTVPLIFCSNFCFRQNQLMGMVYHWKPFFYANIVYIVQVFCFCWIKNCFIHSHTGALHGVPYHHLVPFFDVALIHLHESRPTLNSRNKNFDIPVLYVLVCIIQTHFGYIFITDRK